MTNFIKDAQLPDCTLCKNSRVLVYGDSVAQCGCARRGKPLMRFLETTVGMEFSDTNFHTITPMDDLQAKSLKRLSDFIKWWEPSKAGLYLWSASTGNGKTMLAAGVINELKLASQAIEASVLWDALRSCYDSGEPQKRYLNVAMYTPALLLDDLGMGNTEKADEWLTDILNARIARGLLTIITSNIHPSNLPKASQRAISRIMAHTHPLRLVSETDWRVKLSHHL